jgi:O-methyltransferase
MTALARVRSVASRAIRGASYLRLHGKYREFTMAPASIYWRNMLVVNEHRHVAGCVVECGVWRGGMSGGMAEVLGPSRQYFLFDSFEGLPAAGEQDGDEARKWQADTASPTFYDNCAAPIEFAERAMRLSGAANFKLVKGWFENTLPSFVPPEPIAILRLDGDWYDSTLVALNSLWPQLAPGGIVIIDDYYAWDGCSRAVHDFLSRRELTARVTQRHGVCVIEQRP